MTPLHFMFRANGTDILNKTCYYQYFVPMALNYSIIHK